LAAAFSLGLDPPPDKDAGAGKQSTRRIDSLYNMKRGELYQSELEELTPEYNRWNLIYFESNILSV
jgi:hypothetical protein